MNKFTLAITGLLVVSALSVSAQARGNKKMSYRTAKKECLAKQPSLKGKPLQKCIKAERG